MALQDDITRRQYAEDIILNSTLTSWLNTAKRVNLPSPINFKNSGGTLVDGTAEAHPIYDDENGFFFDYVLYDPPGNNEVFTPMGGFPRLSNYGVHWFEPDIDAWGGGDFGGFDSQLVSRLKRPKDMPLVLFRTGIKKTTPSKITVYMAFPAKDTKALPYFYTVNSSNTIKYMALSSFLESEGDTDWSQYKSLFSRQNAFLINIDGKLSRIWDLPVAGTISQDVDVNGTSMNVKYNIYELYSYDRYDKSGVDHVVKLLVQGLAADSVTTNIYSWSEPHRFVQQTGGRWDDYYSGIFINWSLANTSNNPYSAVAALDAAGGDAGYFKMPAYTKDLITLFEQEYTLKQLDSDSNFDSLSTTVLLPSDLPVLPEYYIDTRPSNFYMCEGRTGTTTADVNKIYDMGTYPYFHPVVKENHLDNSTRVGFKFTKYTVQDGERTLNGKKYSVYGNKIGVGNEQEAPYFGIGTSCEDLILPGNALQGNLSITCEYTVTDSYGWWYYIDNNGNKVYDQNSYTFTIGPQKYKFMVDMDNIPKFTIASGTRFRNHNAKYAVLANNFDYFEYSWKGTAQYAVDPTITLTLTYGDQVVATKTMDGTSNAAQSFQHGPFLIAPTTEGQLVQITGILTDARGRASAEKVFTITDNNTQTALDYMRFYNYSYPSALVQAYRCLADGTPDDENGTYVKLTSTWTFSKLDYGLTTYSEGTSDGRFYLKVKPHSGTLTQDTWDEALTVPNGNKQIMLQIGLNQSIDIELTVTDFIGNTYTASTEFIPSAQVVLDFRAGGDGLAIGKRNEFENALEVEWDTTFYGNVNIKGNVNISGATQAATTADAVSYYDTHSIGGRTVQAAIDALATRAGVSTQQVQAIVNQAISNLNVPTDEHINELIITKINNIVFPPSISEARALELIAIALDDYYDKATVDQKIADATLDLNDVETMIREYVADIPTSDEAVRTANEAKTIAEEAKKAADGAATTANGAATTANNANTNANTAVSTANEAKQTADAAKREIDQFIAGATPTAANVSFNDTISLGANNVQDAIVALFGKLGLNQTQVQALINSSLTNYRTETQIQTMIDNKFNSIVNGNNVSY